MVFEVLAWSIRNLEIWLSLTCKSDNFIWLNQIDLFFKKKKLLKQCIAVGLKIVTFLCKEKNPEIACDLFMSVRWKLMLSCQMHTAFLCIRSLFKNRKNMIWVGLLLESVCLSYTSSFQRAAVPQNPSHPSVFCLFLFLPFFFLNSVWTKDVHLVSSLLMTILPIGAASFCLIFFFLSCIDLIV